MKINWKVRMKNPVFWGQVVVAVIAPILAYLGQSWSDMNPWVTFGGIFVKAVSNPVVIVSVVVSVWNLITDPTTNGLSDSRQALTYQKPKGE